MFNSTAIEVVIGLVFIYILYSLLVTILVELLSSLLSLRGVFLKKAVRRMLEGGGKKKIRNGRATANDEKLEQIDGEAIVVYEEQEGKKDGVEELTFEDFWQRPEIDFLSNKLFYKKRPPSYVSPGTFSSALVNILRKSDKIDKDLRAYKKKLENKERSGTEEILYNILLDTNCEVNAFKARIETWYNETMDRLKGWYKRRLQLFTFIFGFVVAFAMNVDTIQIAKKLTAESDTRLEMVKMATEYAAAENADSTTTVEVDKQVEKILDEIERQESVITAKRPGIDICKSDFWLWVLGCLITTVAISLGSPFWFDILNKISKLRASGTQEKTDAENTGSTKSKK